MSGEACPDCPDLGPILEVEHRPRALFYVSLDLGGPISEVPA